VQVRVQPEERISVKNLSDVCMLDGTSAGIARDTAAHSAMSGTMRGSPDDSDTHPGRERPPSD
jgi:hypothetical protein